MRSTRRPVAVLVACGFLGLQVMAAPLVVSKPEDAGLDSARLRQIEPLIRSHIAQKNLAGAVTLVARRGKVVHFQAFGTTAFDTDAPLRTDTLFRLASMTKPVTAVAVLMLMEEGKLILSDPVSKFLPEFKNPRVATWNLPNDPRGAGVRFVSADHELTLQHLLTHTGGLQYDTGTPSGVFYRQAAIPNNVSLAEFTKRVAALPLNFQPGTQWEYSSNTGFSVLGRVVEIVGGMSLDQFFRQRMFEPLAMPNTFFNVPSPRMRDVAPVYTLGPSGPVRQALPAALPAGVEFFAGSGGLVGSAEDYLQFCQMLLNGGVVNGKRILSRKSVELMTDNAVGDLNLGNYAVEGQELKGYGFGLGVRVRTSIGASGWLGSVGDYGWAGANGTYFWIDPKEQLIGMVMMATRVGRLRTEFPNIVYQAIVD